MTRNLSSFCVTVKINTQTRQHSSLHGQPFLCENHNVIYVEFLIGRDGEFDQLVVSTVRRCKRTVRDDNSALVFVLPYTTAEYRNNELSFHEHYDEVEICTEAAEEV